MKNKSGFAKYEVMTVIVLLMFVFCFLAYNIISGTSPRKVQVMKISATNFSTVVSGNVSSFKNSDVVYLDEVVDEKLISEIENPFGFGTCSGSESKVELINGLPYVTLRCGNYLIDKVKVDSSDKIKLYELGKWSPNKITGDNVEKKTLYNCLDSGKEKYDDYYEELYFVYVVNREFGTNYHFANEISDNCKVVSKTFYRKKEEINVK